MFGKLQLTGTKNVPKEECFRKKETVFENKHDFS